MGYDQEPQMYQEMSIKNETWQCFLHKLPRFLGYGFGLCLKQEEELVKKLERNKGFFVEKYLFSVSVVVRKIRERRRGKAEELDGSNILRVQGPTLRDRWEGF